MKQKGVYRQVLILTILVSLWMASDAFSIQGTIFNIVNNTYFIGGEAVIVARDYMDCVIHCVTIFGHEMCETVGFNKITHSCQMSVVVFENLVPMQGSTYVTAKKAAHVSQCDSLTIPNGVVSIVNTTIGSTATVTCSSGYVATNTAITCQATGSWTDAECLKDCHSLTVDHADVMYTVPGATYLGSTAIVRCLDNYAFRNYDVNATAVCTISGWTDINGGMPNCWELMFRGTMGNGYNISDIYLYGSASYHSSGMTTSLPECKDVFDQTCNLHFRNPNIDNWNSINVDQVRYEFYNRSQTVMSLTILASGSTQYNWLEFGKTDFLDLPWTDIAGNMANTWWAVTDWDTEIGRSFRVIENYGYCTGDILYTFVVFEPTRKQDAPPEDIFCAYETEHSSWPQFMYTLNGVKSNFHNQEYGTATTMAIWVLHG